MVQVKAKNSSDFVFAQCAVDNFIVDLKSAAQASASINEFVNKKLISRAIGARYDPKELEDGKGSNQQLIKMYDAIIFIDRTTAVIPVSARQ